MMENAGRALAQLTRIQLSSLSRRRVVVLAGRGGNGGGGMAAARRLAIWGAEVRVSLLHGADVLLDALLGYSQDGPPRDLEAGLIRTTNARGLNHRARPAVGPGS
jgi:NAD(P)H-hydrate repair Nnr-like enzyme with NAD(P)H-hydrate epimerase domain